MTGRKPKLSPGDVALMRLCRGQGWTADKLAARWRVARSTALRYLRGDTAHHKGAK